jgi:hypothetical protein
MTVFAIFHDLGLAFSDVMLSAEGSGGHMVLPSTGHTRNLNAQLSLSPTRLVRKFFRVSRQRKKGTFLVAGTVKHIEELVRNIKLVKDSAHHLPAKYRDCLCLDEVTSIMHVACLITEDNGYNQFEIAGFIDDVTFARLFDENRALDSAPYFGTTRMAGSGAADLYRWIYERGAQYAERELAHEPPLTKALRTIHLIPSLLLEEDTRASLATIRKGVGGYYESYYVTENGAEPVDSVLTVFAAIKGKGNKSFLELRRVFYHRYVDDWLLIVSLFDLPMEIHPGEAKVLPFKNFELFKVPPLLDEGSEPNWTTSRLAIEMNVAEQFRLSLYREEDGEDMILKRFAEGPNGRRLISAKVVQNNVVFSINQDAFNYFLTRFRSTHPENIEIVLSGEAAPDK